MTAASGPGTAATQSSRGAAFGDVDNDGDIDVVVMNMNAPPSLLRNDYAGGNAWVEIDLRLASGAAIAPGAVVRVTAGGRTQARAILSQSSYYSHDDARVHVGLGSATRVERVDVAWPGGRRESFTEVPIRRAVTLAEGKGRPSQ